MIIIADDVIKDATLAATSVESGFSVDNLKNNKRSSTWRSTAITSQTITATWAAAQTVDAVGIAFANFLVDSTVQVKLYTDTGDPSPVVDSGVKTVDFVYPPPAGFDANNLASFAYGGGNYYFLTLTPAAIKKIEVILVNPSGADAYIEAARIVAGDSVTIASGMSFGANVGFNDLTQYSRTDGGNAIVDRRPVSKKISIDLSTLSTSERAAMQQIIRRNGLHTPVFISAYDSALQEASKTDFMICGYLKDLNEMSLDSAVHSSLNLVIEEI